jgi:hypothetical protein
MAVAHFNVARLLATPGDPRVAGFIDAVTQVNRIAERSPGYVWRLSDEDATVAGAGAFQAVAVDPLLAISLSVWADAGALSNFVHRTLHGAFLRRRSEWFAPWEGPNYVIWPCDAADRPTIADGWDKLRLLADSGPTDAAYDFAALRSGGAA